MNLLKAEILDSSFVLNTPEKAYERSIEYTGFDNEKYSIKTLSDNDNIILVDMNNENLFHLPKDTTNNNKIWKIRFTNVRLFFGEKWYPSVNEEQKIKHYTVYLDAKTGILREIRGQVDTSKEFFTDIKTSNQNDRYVGVVNTVPNISFDEALELAVISQPAFATEIYAICMKKWEGGILRNLWIITGNNIPPFGKYRFTTMSSYVDADSGKLICFGNY